MDAAPFLVPPKPPGLIEAEQALEGVRSRRVELVQQRNQRASVDGPNVWRTLTPDEQRDMTAWRAEISAEDKVLDGKEAVLIATVHEQRLHYVRDVVRFLIP